MNSRAVTPRAWYRRTFAIAVVGSLMMWASQPPLAFGWLAWIAPVPWLLLVQADELPGLRPYRALYFAGLVFWLLAVYWLWWPYPLLTWLGWLALSAYLAVYQPAFVAITRAVMFRFAFPLWLAAPIVWTGLELARAHLLTGFLLASIAHAQVNSIALIQVSDLVGEYGVDFVIVLVAACIAEGLRIADHRPGGARGLRIQSFNAPSEHLPPTQKARRIVVAFVPAIVAIGATLAYGNWRLSQHAELADSKFERGPRVALIQGNSLAEWKQDLGREDQIMREYIQLSEKAIAAAQHTGDGHPVDLVVWPETMYRKPLRSFDTDFKLPPSVPATAEDIVAGDRRNLAALAAHLGVPLLVGVDRFHVVADEHSASDSPTVQAFNSAALVERDGTIVGTYDKMHRVMFGEYIPFAKWIPFLYRLTPLTGGIEPGEKPAALWLRGTYCFVPNICYETVIPHVIRRQVATLKRSGNTPVALVNLTNDAWYWGSSELDMHLACGVFRSIESRTPLVVAANGGISASIDRVGRVRARSGRQTAEFLLADIEPGYLPSWYVQFGDWFAGLCLACCLTTIIVEWRYRRALWHRTLPPPGDSVT